VAGNVQDQNLVGLRIVGGERRVMPAPLLLKPFPGVVHDCLASSLRCSEAAARDASRLLPAEWWTSASNGYSAGSHLALFGRHNVVLRVGLATKWRQT
jgi:hypothetical protein